MATTPDNKENVNKTDSEEGNTDLYISEAGERLPRNT